jgi:hypothetical protein
LQEHSASYCGSAPAEESKEEDLEFKVFNILIVIGQKLLVP